MGGDVGPRVAIEGAALALRELRNSSFLFHGREAEITPILDKFPDSPYRKQATEVLKKVGKKLAEHEWYVAKYYWSKDKPMGTVLRLRRLLDRYRGVGFDVEALWLLGRAYQKVQMPDRARATWQELIEKHPQTGRANDAKNALASLPAPGAAKPAPK